MRHMSIAATLMFAIFSPLQFATASTSDEIQFVFSEEKLPGNAGAGINESSAYMRVFTDVFPLEDCGLASTDTCYRSEYMTFASPPNEKTARWTAFLFEFETVSSCERSIGGKAEVVQVIRSRQDSSIFYFYYSATKGLLGWRVVYPVGKGKIGEDEFLRSASPP